VKLRVAKKVWREEYGLRCPCEPGGWGIHRGSTLARARARLGRYAAQLARGIEFYRAAPGGTPVEMEFDPAILDGLLTGIRPVVPAPDPDEHHHRLMGWMRGALERLQARDKVIVLTGPDLGLPEGVTLINASGGTLTQAMLDEASRVIRESSMRPYSISGEVAAEGDPEKP
jgi:hypothetical protein